MRISAGVQTCALPISEIPYVGEVLFTQSPLTYLAFALVPAVGYGLYRTPLGLALRMVGENPLAVEAQGIDVHRLRTRAVLLGSASMAVAGAFLTISVFDAFYIGMLHGRGSSEEHTSELQSLMRI